MKRPLGVWVISALVVLVGVSISVVAVRGPIGLLPLGLLTLVAGVGLWKMRVWAVGLVALLNLLDLLLALLSPFHLGTVVNLLILGYLFYHRHTFLDANDYPSRTQPTGSSLSN